VPNQYVEEGGLRAAPGIAWPGCGEGRGNQNKPLDRREIMGSCGAKGVLTHPAPGKHHLNQGGTAEHEAEDDSRPSYHRHEGVAQRIPTHLPLRQAGSAGVADELRVQHFSHRGPRLDRHLGVDKKAQSHHR
jgi:hypothetical protein